MSRPASIRNISSSTSPSASIHNLNRFSPPTYQYPLHLHQSPRYRDHGLHSSHGIPIPPRMTLPLEDGYRTPQGEDYEAHFEAQHRASVIHAETSATDRTLHHDAEPRPRTDGRRALDREVDVPVRPPAAVHTRSSDGVASRTSSRMPSFHHKFRPALSAMGEKLDQKIAWRQRLRHYTWNFFSMTMATGGIASVLYNIPYRFNGLDTIGTIFFILNIVLFSINCTCILSRFLLFPETFKASLIHPTESLFAPASVVSIGTILWNITQYGLNNVGHWLDRTVVVLFWIYVALALAASLLTYLVMWSHQTYTISQMTPIWVFPVYPLLIAGPLASLVSGAAPQPAALDIILGGFVCQGIGFMVALMVYSAFIYRLMTQKLPREFIRPGMFVSVGPSAFTSLALVRLSGRAARAFPAQAADPSFLGLDLDLGAIDPNTELGSGLGLGPGLLGGDSVALAAAVVRVLGCFAGLWLWGLAVWFFLVSVGAHYSCAFGGAKGRPAFSMTWFSFVFPNTALVNATFAIGEAFGSPALEWIGCGAAAVLVGMWVFVFVMMGRAVARKQILWPERGEDREEGGFKKPEPKGGLVAEEKVKDESRV